MVHAKIVGLTDDDFTRYVVYVGFAYSSGFSWHKWPAVSATTLAAAREFCERNSLNICTPTQTYDVKGSRRYCPNNGVLPLI